MIKLEDFKQQNLEISWKLINIGFHGSTDFYEQLSIEDIINYSISLLNAKYDNKEVKKLIENIACEYKENSEEVNNIIRKLIEYEHNIDEKIEFRKWIYMYVYKNLKKNDDYIQGLISMTDIWAKLKFPKNSPHIVQGLNNNIEPKKYYTLHTYERILKEHLNWLTKELKYLQNKDKYKRQFEK